MRTALRDRPAAVPPGLEVLEPFVVAGVFSAYEVQFAATVSRLQPGLSDAVLLALAVSARAPRFGHVCWRLSDLSAQMAGLDGEEFDALGWLPADEWTTELAGSEVVAGPGQATTEPLRPLVLDAGRLYLQRYWRYELAVAGDLVRRASGADGGDGGDGDAASPEWSGPAVEEVLDDMFGREGTAGNGDTAGAGYSPGTDLQRQAARRGLQPGVSIIAGGPGTGKTFTVARLLAAAQRVAALHGRELEVALAAPTGKAATRMGDAVSAAVQALEAAGAVDPDLAARLVGTVPTTIQSLLGWRDQTHFRHGRDDPLRHDLVIIDETSMVSLPLMAKLLDAVRPGARLVLVGDPFQLASIEAGTVMRDVVGPEDGAALDGAALDGAAEDGAAQDDAGPGAAAQDDAGPAVFAPTLPGFEPVDAQPPPPPRPARPPRPALAGRVTVLKKMRRFGEGSTIAALADAVRRGDTDAAVSLLAEQRPDVRWVQPDDAVGIDGILEEVSTAGVAMVGAALAGDGPGALAASDRVKVLTATRRGPSGLDEWTGRIEASVSGSVAEFRPGRRWHIGRPVLVTVNDRENGVFNGDVGVVVDRDGAMEVALSAGDQIRYLAPSRLDDVETWWAMTIHKSQGSEFTHAVVSLPDPRSPILSRELLYTAVTRARDRLTLVGTEAAVRAAIDRPLTRASGLHERLWPD